MSLHQEHHPAPEPADARRPAWRRLVPLAIVATLVIAAYATGWHRELSLENLVHHRATLDGFIAAHKPVAVLAYIGLYITVAALSIPAGAWLTITGGFLFGALVGALSAIVGATLGATALFLIAQSAVGEHIARRAGPLVGRFAAGFRADAFNYLLVLRLVPIFPFWLVNLVPALVGVRLQTFVLATFLGIIPGTFVYASLGNGLGSLVEEPDLAIVFRPSVLVPIIGLAVLALIPVGYKRWRDKKAA